MTETKEIIVVLDRSGSMYSCLDDTLGGFNSFKNEQEDGTLMTLITFGSDITKVYEKEKVEEAQDLSKKNYKTTGSTALMDAIGFAIKLGDEAPCCCTPQPKTMVILTDGLENSSKKYTKAHINDLITDRRNRGWEFVFLAANQDAIVTGQQIGIPEEAALTFSQTDSTQDAFMSAASAILRCSTGETKNVSFVPVERQRSMGRQPNLGKTMTAPPTISETGVQSLHSNEMVAENGGLYLEASSQIPDDPKPPKLKRCNNKIGD